MKCIDKFTLAYVTKFESATLQNPHKDISGSHKPKRRRSKFVAIRKSKNLNIRITENQLDDLKKRADRLGISVSEFVILGLFEDPKNISDILRKATPKEKADPELIRRLGRMHALLNQIARALNILAKSSQNLPALQTKIITKTLLEMREDLNALWKKGSSL